MCKVQCQLHPLVLQSAWCFSGRYWILLLGQSRRAGNNAIFCALLLVLMVRARCHRCSHRAFADLVQKQCHAFIHFEVLSSQTLSSQHQAFPLPGRARPFQGPSIFRRSCILDSVHCRCSLPPPLGPSPGTPLGLSSGGADLTEAQRECNRGGTVLGMGTLGGPLLLWRWSGGPASSGCLSPELWEMAGNCAPDTSRARC